MSSAHDHPNQFALLGQRRFAPFFWTQFLGAFNDNLFKFAFTVLVTFKLSVSWLPAETAGAIIAGVFILPFLLFSATSGQLADKYDKTRVIQGVKSLEVVIMLLAAPITVGVAALKGQWTTAWNLVSAGSVLAALPSVAMFFAMQKHFVAGLTFGATKG